jgi:ATP-dependent DNA helicase RecQ
LLSPLEALKKYFGYDSFRDNQADIVNSLINKKDTLVIMPTGGGKSVCYQIPASIMEGTAIVVSPLIALMKDQVDALNQNGIKSAYYNSTVTTKAKQEILDDVNNGSLKLLYVSPERLLEPKFYNWLKSVNVSLLAIDEAHCVSMWGASFRKEYAQLGILTQDFPNVPKIALTATANDLTKEEIIKVLSLESGNHFECGFDRPNITYHVQSKYDENEQLHEYIKDNHMGEAGVVYCLSRKKTEEVAKFLNNKGINAYHFHARMRQDDKDAVLKTFLNNDDVVIVATIAFGMGIDKPNVRFVCHVDLPSSVEAYYQETGRAGRDGLPSSAWMLYGLKDVTLRQKMLNDSNADDLHKRIETNALNAIFSFSEVTSCRRQVLLNYFGQDLPEPCGNCDNCINPPETVDATVIVQKGLSAIFRTGQIFGANHLIQVLLGKENIKITQRKHNELGVFGAGKELNDNEWKTVFRQLTVLGYISIDPEYGALKLNEKCRPILQGKQYIYLGKNLLSRKASKPKKVKVESQITDSSDIELLNKLKVLRLKFAKESGMPTYVIFKDKTLEDMIHLKPQNKDDMLMVSGIGEVKFERYGEHFLTLLNA